MNLKVLKAAEKRFLREYPGGFTHPEMVKHGKRHKMQQMEKMARESFAKKAFSDADFIVAETAKLMSRSSMISMFEKPKYKNMITKLTTAHKKRFSDAVYELLHGKEKGGFDMFLHELEKRQLAKWTYATAIQTYYRPNKEVLIKPNTTKLIINKLELDLTYNSAPSWAFYRDYRKIINHLKTKVDKSLAPNNPAFSGFLMFTLGDIDAGK